MGAVAPFLVFVEGFPMNEESSRRSKLLEMLHQSAGLGSRPIGFGVTEPSQRPRRVLLVALPQAEPALAEAAVRAGADALLLATPLDRDGGRAALARIGSAGAGVPRGLYLEYGPAIPSVALSSTDGVDFVIARAEEAPLSYLKLDIARGIAIDDGLPLGLARSINDLPLDFVLFAPVASATQTSGMSLRQMLSLRALAEGIRKPALLSSVYLRGPEDARVVDDLGIDSLFLDAREAAGSADTIEALVGLYRRALDSLGVRARRPPSDLLPTLPRLHHRPLQEAEPEEPDEE